MANPTTSSLLQALLQQSSRPIDQTELPVLLLPHKKQAVLAYSVMHCTSEGSDKVYIPCLYLECHGDPNLYLYLFVQHVCPITCADLSHITGHFRDNPVTLYGCTLAELQGVVASIPVRKFSLFKESDNPRIGYNRAGYIEGGWQFSMRQLPSPVMTHRLAAQWLGQVKPAEFQMTEGWVKARLQAAFNLKMISTDASRQ